MTRGHTQVLVEALAELKRSANAGQTDNQLFDLVIDALSGVYQYRCWVCEDVCGTQLEREPAPEETLGAFVMSPEFDGWRNTDSGWMCSGCVTEYRRHVAFPRLSDPAK